MTLSGASQRLPDPVVAQEHPRRNSYLLQRKKDRVILITNGHFAGCPDHAWLPRLELLTRTLDAVEECFRRGEDFDITVDDGRPINGHWRVVKPSEKEWISHKGTVVGRCRWHQTRLCYAGAPRRSPDRASTLASAVLPIPALCDSATLSQF
ncbi:MAG TPA: hypothetical protein P5205_11645 [Candidatus Paceibacterota bacterium]|nr:hypothetical protein [Verrucomicrobiota bacterium]HSA11012.1 hypothetical protein [Candidatus Paceibacterota bacterium]